MNTIISVINGWSVGSAQAVIEKHYSATGEVIAKIQHTTSAILHEDLMHTLEINAKVKAKYV